LNQGKVGEVVKRRVPGAETSGFSRSSWRESGSRQLEQRAITSSAGSGVRWSEKLPTLSTL
jgi:hypothetical protein